MHVELLFEMHLETQRKEHSCIWSVSWFEEKNATNRPIFKIFMKIKISHHLGYILGYAKALYTVRPEQPYHIQSASYAFKTGN